MMPAVKDQGIYGPTGALYLLSQSDSSVILRGNKSMLKAAGMPIPTAVDDAWTGETPRSKPCPRAKA